MKNFENNKRPRKREGGPFVLPWGPGALRARGPQSSLFLGLLLFSKFFICFQGGLRSGKSEGGLRSKKIDLCKGVPSNRNQPDATPSQSRFFWNLHRNTALPGRCSPCYRCSESRSRPLKAPPPVFVIGGKSLISMISL